MQTTYPMKWNLDSLYKGGSASAAFEAELKGLEADTAKLVQSLQSAAGPADEAPGSKGGTAEQLSEWTSAAQSILQRLRQAESFVGCLMAENVKDAAAGVLNGRVQTVMASFLSAMTRYDDRMSNTPDEQWEAWLQSAEAAPASFYLQERREAARDKMAPELEALAGQLAVDGYHGWGDHYNTIVSRAKFNVPGENGETKVLSAGQMNNRLSGGERSVRAEAFSEWEREWSEHADLCADTLNRIAGFRLKLYEQRGWSSVLKEPLAINRMSEATLQAMWSAIEEGKPLLVKYLERKAELLGLDKLDWHDVEAPISSAARTVGYDEAAAFIRERFREFSPDLAAFTETAFTEGWIEAEDRAGKRPGGFCTSFPKSGETRIFMTYSGTASNVSTLAHELGHGYHQHVMNDLPPFAQEYAMNVAETASTFAEMIVADSALKAAADAEEKLALLEDKIQSAVSFFMNIHARFLFETRFYELRRQGTVTRQELCRLMEEAQREAFCNTLGEAHPHFWASKLHFYLTDVPFYNFPYTFGYLFSAGLYARSIREGASFAPKYVELLRDTGRMTVEELASKHLGVKLEEPGFWREAVAITTADIGQFLEMTQ
ncbi:M3 family oligoendopeptidase [Paenibacillus beijingensis]|uniref:Oligoendopeptidase n=1 Tax=Paenibacillus beijingensis TaxID=1126833 RepID=A0A0D5NFU7_9BACL|nr:M3 family oligoendopeptidase [Paenibacillus beijingensis]AJY73783.1 oligoendopeptidase [Paenibacillus beijingensis]